MNKKKIAITMRDIEVNGEKHNAIANSWFDLAELLDIELRFIHSNDIAFLEKIESNDYDALILSGGGDIDEQFRLSNEKFILKNSYTLIATTNLIKLNQFLPLTIQFII